MRCEEVRRFRVGSVLGRGGFGTVYRADLLGVDGFWRAVALKLLNAGVDATGEVAGRLRDEARLLGLLRHRAIVQVDGLARLDGRWAVVMEYVEGADLREVLAQGGMPVGTALEVVQEVSAALQAGYDAPGPDGLPLRLLHRDVKPANVLLAPSGEVKLLDYGIARAEFAGRETETQTLCYGSLPYLAPERLDFVDGHAGDVYAAGVLLAELITGESFGETTTDAREHAEKVAAVARKVRRCAGEDALVALIEDVLAFDAESRPTARDLEHRTRALRGRFPDDPWLSDWAELFVPPLLAQRPCLADELSGATLVDSEEPSSGTSTGARVRVAGPSCAALGLAGGFTAALLAATAAVLAVLVYAG